ncbi:MAG TPA: hypothetical protein DIT64_05440 [Verrucomicrobiales bacterium]|nr:hypothetical protein [Verrucomicrobiales bacterium]
MNPNYQHEDASEAEVAALSGTVTIASVDTRAVRERLACAAALLSCLTEQPSEPSLVHQPQDESPPRVLPVGGELRVGRMAGGIGCLPDCAELSRMHFRVHVDKGCFILEDLGSRNGTRVDGVKEPVTRRALRDGDFILAGGQVFLFVNPVDE